jgi:hypothetical protein
MGFFHILKVYIMYRNNVLLAALLAILLISTTEAQTNHVANPTFELTYEASSPTIIRSCDEEESSTAVRNQKIRKADNDNIEYGCLRINPLDPTRSESNAVAHWYSPTMATPDYFHTNGSPNYRVPSNIHENTLDHKSCTTSSQSVTKNAMAGIWIRENVPSCDHSNNKVREYISQKLGTKLLKRDILSGKTGIYKISFWVYHADYGTPTDASCQSYPTKVALQNFGIALHNQYSLNNNKYCINNQTLGTFGTLSPASTSERLLTKRDYDGYGWGRDANGSKWEKFEVITDAIN